METLQLDLTKRYTYADYLTWMDDVRRELFDGFIKLMSPGPSMKHQEISFEFSRILGNFLRHKTCKGFAAPADVRFPKKGSSTENDKIFTVLQPDIFVVCDLHKIEKNSCLGAPDFIIEIVSPKNSKRDVKDKFEIYQEHGVREYWIVNPNDENVTVFVLSPEGKFEFQRIYADDEKIPVNIFDGDLKVDLAEVFA